jgi:S1-C subfamily serine protease
MWLRGWYFGETYFRWFRVEADMFFGTVNIGRFFPSLVGLLFAAGALSLHPLSAVAEDSLAEVIERCDASVVRIEVKGYAGEGLGSGFVVSEDGTVVTNVHVLAGAKSAVAIFPNGKRYSLVGTYVIDEGKDICVAKMKARELTPIALAEELPRKGETVTALGAPLGLSFTATTGIVSAIRPGLELGKEIGDDSMRGTWVQVDAALSPGNSGGPLINSFGEVVAMSTRASFGRAQNLNFGISIVDIRRAIENAKTKPEQTLAAGVGKIRDRERATPGVESLVDYREVPQESFEAYFDEGRSSFSNLVKHVRRSTTRTGNIISQMRKGKTYIPSEYGSRSEQFVKMRGRNTDTYFFKDERTKWRMVRKGEKRLEDLKALRSKISDSSDDRAVLALLTEAGPPLDTRGAGSIGFLEGAVALHAFNDHEIVVDYDGGRYLMWTKSTTGLARGEEMVPMPVFVAGTKTVLIPGLTSMSITILQEVTKDQLEDAMHEMRNYATWRDNSGKYSIEAELLQNDGEYVHLRKRDGTKVKVPVARLDEASRRIAEK